MVFTLKVDRQTYQDLAKEKRRIQRMQNELSNRQPLLRKMHDKQYKKWEANFVAEGGSYNIWSPLAEFTNNDRESQGYAREHPMLVRSGGLISYFLERADSPKYKANSMEWSFQTGVDGTWMFTHQFGMRNPIAGRNDIPARKMVYSARKNSLGLSPDEQDEMVDLTDEWVDRIVARYYSS